MLIRVAAVITLVGMYAIHPLAGLGGLAALTAYGIKMRRSLALHS